MNSVLNIFWNKENVGRLRKSNQDTLHFKYSKKWLENPNRFSITPALELSEEEFDNRLTKSYFENLLPEGETLRTLEKLNHKSMSHSFQFLKKFGAECAGAFVISPLNELPESKKKYEKIELKKEEIFKIYKEKKSLFIYGLNNKNAKFSLAGAQDKLPIIYENDKIFLPNSDHPTTHILKPPSLIKEAYESVYNEYICLKIAKKIGFTVPKVKLIGGDPPLFLIERYDRQKLKDQVVRLHQYDLCQGQGFLSTEKYEEDGGPSLADNFKFIEEQSDNKIPDLETYMDWIAFNLVIGNNDCHAKNISFLFENGEWRLAPIYDILAISIYEGFDEAFSYELGNVVLWNEMHKEEFCNQLMKMGYKRNSLIFKNSFLKIIQKVSATLEGTIQEVEKEHGHLKLKNPLLKEVQKRCNFFSKVFSDV